jgi:hypothetical protein
VQDASTTVLTINTAVNQYRVHLRNEVHKQQTLRHHTQLGVDEPPELFQDLEMKDLKIEYKEQTGEEFVPEDESPEEDDSPEDFEEPTYLNQQEQLKHIRELITDVEHQTQLATEEQDVVEQTKNEHTAHNVEQYNLLLEWLDGRADLLERLLINTELYYTSIRKWAAARTNKDERRYKKYYIQRGEYKQHVKVLQ